MKNLIELKASKKLAADHIVKAVLLDVGSPPPGEPDKQPITLCLPPGDIKMGCNIIGKHLHIDPAEKGKVIWITCKKDGAVYLSYFEDEKKHFLTVRDGVMISFRPLAADVKMHNPKDRLPYLADHYRACYEEATRAMKGIIDDQEFLTPIATALWIETKAGVIVPTSELPKERQADPEPKEKKPKPDISKVDELTPEKKEEIIAAHAVRYSKLKYPALCEAIGKAVVFLTPNSPMDAHFKFAALTRIACALEESKPKIWEDAYDDAWQRMGDENKAKLDNLVAACFAKKPNITPSAAHKIACLLFGVGETKDVNEEIESNQPIQ